ncbi:MAG: hypothetical protein AAFX94_11680, partial [Myxococcota bacterium]
LPLPAVSPQTKVASRVATLRALELARFEDRLVTAMVAVGNELFVATGPKAEIHRVKAGSKARKVATLDATFVWGLTAGKGSTLFAVTGAPGTVVRIDGEKTAVLFEPEQENMRSIAYDPDLGLFAGGGQRGILYRSTDLKTFRALYDTNNPEVTSIVLAGGNAYVSGVSGAQALVKAQGQGETKGVDVTSQMVRVSMDGGAETLAGSSDEAIFAMGIDARGHVLVATGATGRDDPRGRIYSIEPKEREIALIYQSPSRRITHLMPMSGNRIAAVAAAGGRVVEMNGALANSGEFFTAPFDAGINARFGEIRLYGAWPTGTSVTAAIRTGQTSSPDSTWSEWSKEIAGTSPGAGKVPNGRFMQARLTLKGNGKETPSVHRVRVAYLRQNLPPFVREVVTLEKGVALLEIQRPPQASATVNLDANNASANQKQNERKNPGARARKVKERGALTVRWVAEDPNGDDLEYALRYRSLGNRDWTEIDNELDAPFYTLNSAQLPDGHYQFQVRATDAPSNPDGVSMADTRESRAVLIDNTPPKVERAEVRVSGGVATVRVAVADNVGPVMSAEFAVDGRDFRPMPPDDGVLDGSGETFTLRIPGLAKGSHSVTVRVSDEADNEGYGQARFTIR